MEPNLILNAEMEFFLKIRNVPVVSIEKALKFFLNASPLSCPSTGADTCADMRLQIQNIGHQYQWYLVLVPVVFAAKKFIFNFSDIY